MSRVIKGISFPFRIGSKGGVVMSIANVHTTQHLEESIEQILNTRYGERVMEYIGSRLSSAVFDPNDESIQTLISYEIVDAIKEFDQRILLTEDDIEFTEDDDEKVLAIINFKVKENDETQTIKIEIGGYE